jgi:DNA helicase-2/ATP-dependent DNA helicase PcrA
MSDPFDLANLEVPEAPAAVAPVPPAMLAQLNEAQRQAVEATEGPVLVLAGAGTGKTRVLTTRLGYILARRLAYPSQILAVTFTNKAAREMRERVGAMIGGVVEGMWLGTFHAMAARMLRRHAELVGLKANFTILDTDDQHRLLKQLLQAEGIDEKRWPPRALAAVIDRWKDKGLAPDKVQAHKAKSEDGEGFAEGRAAQLYAQYQERLVQLNACDFGDLMLHMLTIFTTQPDVLKTWQKRFRYILVDEYQDTNLAQYLWLRLLAQLNKNICCVGDDDQSIYGWRGAEVGNILRFEADFDGARVIRLERNYRSTPHILGAASGIIAKNENRLGKTLWTDLNDGEKVTVRGVWDGSEEARVVGEQIEAYQRDKQALSEMAILVRAGFQTREFEERFITLGVPYRVIGGLRFYERAEIRDAIAYFRTVVQPDDDLAFERILNVPKRGLAEATLQALYRAARAGNSSLTQAAELLVTTDELKPKPRNALRELLAGFGRWRSLLDAMPHTELAETILDESGYTAMWQQDKSVEAPGRLENLKELVRALEQFENLGGFLEHVSLVMENETTERADMVNLMTLHAAKGLEFDTVFLPGWEEGLFPHQRALEQGGVAGLEEERRLAYVGITRARQRCLISFAANRRVFNQWQSSVPSRFIDELPAEHVERAAEQGLYGYGGLGGSGNGSFVYDAPWLAAERRLAASGYRAGTGRTIDGTARRLDDAAPAKTFQAGARVFHQKFGYGRILHVDADRLEIDFEKAGRKKVVSSFVDPA